MNNRRRVHATLAGAGAIIMALAGTPVRADEPPDAGDVVDAYLTVRGWVDAFDVPAPDEAAARVPIAGATGVCIVLRRAGEIVGTGVDATGDDLMVRRAAGRALSQLHGHPAIAGLPQAMRDQVGRRVTLQVEVGGGLVPLLGTTFDEVATQLDPGLDGVAVRRGGDVAACFPAQMLASNTAGRPERMLPALAVDVGLPATPLPALAERFDVSLYRFRATSLAQADPQGTPFVTIRGETVVEDGDVTRASLAEAAGRLAGHLAEAAAGSPAGLLGTYRPVADDYEPLVSPPLDQALAAWALARCAASAVLGDADTASLRETGTTLLRQLGERAGDDDPLADPVACAAIVHAAIAGGVRGEPIFDRAVQAVRAAFVPGAGMTKGVSGHGQALIAAALARLLATGTATVAPSLVRDAIDAAWTSVPEHRQVSLLPWIAWAEADYARATGEPMAHVDTMRRMRVLLDESRITRSKGDLDGGFELTRGDRLQATSQSLRPACFVAWMVREPALTSPDERTAALGNVLDTARFVLQLTVRDASLWAYRNPTRAVGGVKQAPWDVDQPVPAQALGLVALVETLESIDGGKRRSDEATDRRRD